MKTKIHNANTAIIIALVFIKYWEMFLLDPCALKVKRTAIVPAPVVIGKVIGKNNLFSSWWLKFFLAVWISSVFSCFGGERNSQPVLQIIIPPATCIIGIVIPNNSKIQCPIIKVTRQIKKAYNVIRLMAFNLSCRSKPEKYGLTIKALPRGLITGNNAINPMNIKWIKELN